ncbi:CHAT domain-containing protein [Sinorhizobium meliloti]|uniref:CHAT domain-containing protein n=1 Tax=Rhizobium meliloti TaxID=382 RepID=UPI0034E8E16C
MPQSDTEAVRWYRLAAEQGLASAQNNLGVVYDKGRGVPQSDTEAVRWYRLAAEQGLASAQNNLGVMYDKGRGVPQSETEAVRWYRLAAQQDYAKAQYNLGVMYGSGAGGLPRDQLKKYDLLRKAVENGYPNALLQLSELELDSDWDKGLMIETAARYANDRLTEAAEWLEQAVAKHVPGAEFAMGNLHLRGDPPSHRDTMLEDQTIDPRSSPKESAFRPSAAKAAAYYRQAIAEGSVAARLNLARLLELGHGVPRDLGTARSLYQQAENAVFEGPARLGLLRLAFADVWDGLERRHDLLRKALNTAQAASTDTLIVKPRSRFVAVEVADAAGRRYFSGDLPQSGYRPPKDAKGLILWHEWNPLSEEVEIEVGGRSIPIPPGDRFGIRLDAAALLDGKGVYVPWPTEFGAYPESVPEETRVASRIVLIGRSGAATIHVSTEDELIGFTEELGTNDRFFVPDAPGLTLDLQSSASSDAEALYLAVVVDGSERVELVAQKGCVIRLVLAPDKLLRARMTGRMPLVCDAMTDAEQIPLVTASGGEILGHVAKSPDESIPGVIAGFLGINRHIAVWQMQMGGQWDALLRASRIVMRVEMRNHGPNSPAVLAAGLKLAEVEAAMGNVKAAQKLLNDTIERLKRATYTSNDLQSDVYFRIGEFQLQLGHHAEAEQFLMLALSHQLHYNELTGRPKYENILRIYDALAELSARLRKFDHAIAYRLRSFVIDGNPERAETFTTEIGPTSVIQIVGWLKLTERDREADGLLRYLHQQTKREFARDLPEPLVFPLDLTVFESTFGPVDRSTLLATAMANLGRVYNWMGRNQEALPLLAQNERTLKNLFGENSPRATGALAEIATTQLRAGMQDDAVETARRAWRRSETYASTRETVRQEAAAAPVASMTPAGMALLNALYVSDRRASATEAFGIAQRLHSSSTALAMESFGDRLALESDEARLFLRQRQDLAEQLADLDRELAVAMLGAGAGSQTSESAIREGIAAAERRMADLNRNRPPEVTKLDELARVPVLPADEVKRFLNANELLISYIVSDEACYAWTIDSEGKVHWVRLPVTGVALEKTVNTFRQGLGPGGLGRSARSLVAPERVRVASQLSTAYDLYRALFAPLEDVLRGKQHLTIVANGVLTSLPFHALISSKPDPNATNPWRAAKWLIRDYAISLTPSVASLRAIKRLQRSDSTQTAYLGIGDPAIGPETGPMVRATFSGTESLFRTAGLGQQGVSSYFRGGLADVERVRLLPRLADTAIEVRTVAKSLLAQGSIDLLLGQDATETRLKALPLDRFRIIHFATHGLVSGDIVGLAEPALVMTPPAVPSQIDDGLLTASEIARFQLNAGWVILSACNTAGGERPEAEALSGLARSFFYAGARSVLVSHWPVISSAAVRLTTRAFDEMARDASVDRAEALRRSMLALIDNGEPHEANPGYWAPFVIVGDGGRD